jgi:hypothetical protein
MFGLQISKVVDRPVAGIEALAGMVDATDVAIGFAPARLPAGGEEKSGEKEAGHAAAARSA